MGGSPPEPGGSLTEPTAAYALNRQPQRHPLPRKQLGRLRIEARWRPFPRRWPRHRPPVARPDPAVLLADPVDLLDARLEMLADGERRLRELEELPALVEEYLGDLPDLIEGTTIHVQRHETVPPERTPENPLGIYTLTPERIRKRAPEELEEIRKERERERGARYRELYAMLGLRAAVYADGTLEITVGATSGATKGVMLCIGAASPCITSTTT